MKNYLNVIHVHALINNSYDKINKCTNVNITLLRTICHSSDMFQSTLSIFRELLLQSSIYKKHRWIIRYIKICA